VDDQKAREAAHLAKRAPIEDSALSELAPESEFARFEDLARKLVNVPKKEVDEKRHADE